MSGDRGFYRMQRGWLDNPILAREAYCRRSAWIWLIENAAWRDTVVKIDGKPVSLERGELSVSEQYLARVWRWPRSRVHRFLKEIATLGMIRIRSARQSLDHLSNHLLNHLSDHLSDRPQNILCLCNYRKYQDGVAISEPQTEPASEPSFEPSFEHNKKEKKENEKKESEANASDTTSAAERKNGGRGKQGTRLAADWQPSAEDRAFAADECGLDPDRVGDIFRDYWIGRPGAGGVKLDWSATFRNWCRKECDSRGVRGGRPIRDGSRPGGIAAALRDILGDQARH